jgi:hypothetical protein
MLVFFIYLIDILKWNHLFLNQLDDTRNEQKNKQSGEDLKMLMIRHYLIDDYNQLFNNIG